MEENKNITIEFFYIVSCGLDGYHVLMPEMPSPEQAMEIILGHCIRYNIDPYFATAHTAWYQWDSEKREKISKKLNKAFLDTQKERIAEHYKLQKEKFTPIKK